MAYPVSVFIMDVSNSSKEGIGGELSNYLHHLAKEINIWTQDITETKVRHRAGDEIVVATSGYATAYILAFYINQIWPFKEHKPYFGLAFGNIQNAIPTINIETWIHPLMKQARHANDILKQQKQNRDQFSFELTNSLQKKSFEEDHFFRSQFETLLNAILKLQQDQMNDQTNTQSLVCSLFLILNQQNKIAHYLDRSASTVSSHLKKGKYESIMDAFNDIVKVLTSLELKSIYNSELTHEQLQQNFKRMISDRLTDYFPIK